MSRPLAAILADAVAGLPPDEAAAVLAAVGAPQSLSRMVRLDRRDEAIRQAFVLLASLPVQDAAEAIRRIWRRAGPNIDPSNEAEGLVYRAAMLNNFGRPLSCKTLKNIRIGSRTPQP